MESGTEPQRRRVSWTVRAERFSEAFGLVLLLILATYVLASIVPNKGWGGVLLTVTTSTTAIVALTSSDARPVVVHRSLWVAILSTVLAMVSAIAGGHGPLNVASVLVLGLLALGMAAVLKRVVTASEVSSRTILGAISVYTSLGIFFTWAYGLIDRIEGGGFFGPGIAARGSDFLFFSYTTLTTTGYGDLVPVGKVGRMISGFEMMIGQVFLVTLVAGLVTLWRPGQALVRRRERREGEASPEAPGAP
jgi:Ion channel